MYKWYYILLSCTVWFYFELGIKNKQSILHSGLHKPFYELGSACINMYRSDDDTDVNYNHESQAETQPQPICKSI